MRNKLAGTVLPAGVRPLPEGIKVPLEQRLLLEAISRLEAARASAMEGMVQVCPHCGQAGRVGVDFGIRTRSGKQVPHSWCKECRYSKCSHRTRWPDYVCPHKNLRTKTA